MNTKKRFTKVMMFVLVFTIIASSTFTAFGASGKWIKSGNRWWYRHTDSSYTTNGWEKINNKWYHFDNKGWMQTGWLKVSGKWYYLNPNGDMATGWKKVKGEWYYLNSNGAMAVNWKKVNGNWYYLDERDGAMVSDNFIFWKQNQYYLKSNGAMATEWYKIDGDWYYFESSGALCKNKWIGNDYVASDGKWTTDTEIVLKEDIVSIDISYYECVPVSAKTVSTEDTAIISQLSSYVTGGKLMETPVEPLMGGTYYTITFNYADSTSDFFSINSDDDIMSKGNVMYDIDSQVIVNIWNSLQK